MDKQIPITIATTVYKELVEITNLINFVHPRIGENDEILIQYDEDSVTDSVYKYLNILDSMHSNIRVIGFPLGGDFATFKNNLKKHAKGIFIFNIDADEIPHEFLLTNIHEIVEANKDVDLFFIPRINTVDGITQQHIKKWGWKISKLDTQIGEKELDKPEYDLLKKHNLIIEEGEKTKYYKPIIQFPDYQTRLYRRTSEIEWVGKVHEQIAGYNTITILPKEEQYCLYHHKTIERQSAQNQFYETL